jgi:trk system potassium uptake protein
MGSARVQIVAPALLHAPRSRRPGLQAQRGRRTPSRVAGRGWAGTGSPYNQRALKLLIVGCGRVGSQLAADMDKAGHEVVIIDRDPDQFSRAASRGVLTNDFRGNQVVGNGTDSEVLRRAGIEDADGFVAVTEGDNRNIMASQVAKHIFKVPRVVARIYDPERAEAYEKLGLHTICPTIEGAKAIEKTLLDPK